MMINYYIIRVSQSRSEGGRDMKGKWIRLKKEEEINIQKKLI